MRSTRVLLREARTDASEFLSTAVLIATVPLLIALSGCGGPRQIAPPPPPPPPPAPPVEVPAPEIIEARPPYTTVWTTRPEIALFDGISHTYSIERVFTRLEVVGQDSLGVRLRCAYCPEPAEGYAAPGDVVFNPVPPEVAAWGELAEFALAVRTAAERGDVQALRPVMSPDFSFSFDGIQSAETAVAVWEGEQFNTLARVPELLDRGLSTRDGRIWSGPPEFVSGVGYNGLRMGFHRRADGRWEWIYLIRGSADR